MKTQVTTHLPQLLACWVILHAFSLSADFFKLTFFKMKNALGINCQKNWIQIRPDFGPDKMLHKLAFHRPLMKSACQKIYLLISQPKHMLWVLKRTVSVRLFF